MRTSLYIFICLVVVILSPLEINAQDSLLNSPVIIESTQDNIQESIEEKVGFVGTFVRTPLVFFVIFGTLLSLMLSSVIELFMNIFTLFNYGFSNTIAVFQFAWNDIVLNWWWNVSKTWHLFISGFFWLSVWGSSKKRKRK